MVQVKMMNEELFSKLHKEVTIAGELIRARQEEKQGLLDEFDAECKRFFFGKISEKSLAASVKKTNKELIRLDSEIRRNISRARIVASKIMQLSSAQAPVAFRASLSGIVGGGAKKVKKKHAKHHKKKRK
jgi:hypothetical protein